MVDIEAHNRKEKMLKLKEELFSVEEESLNGSKGYSAEEAVSIMRNAVRTAEKPVCPFESNFLGSYPNQSTVNILLKKYRMHEINTDEYQREEENSIAKVMALLETIDETDVSFTEKQYMQMIEALINNEEIVL